MKSTELVWGRIICVVLLLLGLSIIPALAAQNPGDHHSSFDDKGWSSRGFAGFGGWDKGDKGDNYSGNHWGGSWDKPEWPKTPHDGGRCDPPAVSPEPVSSALFLLGSGAIVLVRKLRKKA